MSDRIGTLPTLEMRMDDLRAVMDAVGSARAALMGVSGRSMAILFAVTCPDRTWAPACFVAACLAILTEMLDGKR